ncbi:MAG: hypothetical protein P8Y97_23050, partial [Candidatus Lokiarchaeota archaeon]
GMIRSLHVIFLFIIAGNIVLRVYRDAEIVRKSMFLVNSERLNRFLNYIRKYQSIGFTMEVIGLYHHMIYRFLTRKLNKVS